MHVFKDVIIVNKFKYIHAMLLETRHGFYIFIYLYFYMFIFLINNILSSVCHSRNSAHLFLLDLIQSLFTQTYVDQTLKPLVEELVRSAMAFTYNTLFSGQNRFFSKFHEPFVIVSILFLLFYLFCCYFLRKI